MADPSLSGQRPAWPSSPYFSLPLVVSHYRLKSVLGRNRGADLCAVLLRLDENGLKVELGVVGVGYHCALNVSSCTIKQRDCIQNSNAMIFVFRSKRQSVAYGRPPASDHKYIPALTTVALALRRVLLCPGSLCLVDKLLLALVVVLCGGDLVLGSDSSLV
jgi:hypothetical protein